MQHHRTRRIVLLGLAAASLWAVAPGTAMAQSGGKAAEQVIRPPAPTKEEEPAVMMQYFFLVVIGAAAIGANLVPSKRGHQD